MEWTLLDSLSEEDRRRVLAAARRRKFARREVLFHEGDPGDTLHLIAKGRVAVRVTTPLGDVATLLVRGPGEVVGELALLDDAALRTATVVALEPVETLSLHREQFRSLREQHPEIDQFLIAVLAASLRRMSSQLIEALYTPADTRILRRLLELAEEYGNGAAGTDIPLTQEDLGSLAGTSRATVNRVLGEMEAKGAVEVGRGRVRIVDPGLLARRAR